MNCEFVLVNCSWKSDFALHTREILFSVRLCFAKWHHPESNLPFLRGTRVAIAPLLRVGSMRLFLGRLAPAVTVDDIARILEDLSAVDNLHLKQTYGFIDFPNDETAMVAMQKLGGMLAFPVLCFPWLCKNQGKNRFLFTEHWLCTQEFRCMARCSRRYPPLENC